MRIEPSAMLFRPTLVRKPLGRTGTGSGGGGGHELAAGAPRGAPTMSRAVKKACAEAMVGRSPTDSAAAA